MSAGLIEEGSASAKNAAMKCLSSFTNADNAILWPAGIADAIDYECRHKISHCIQLRGGAGTKQYIKL